MLSDDCGVLKVATSRQHHDFEDYMYLRLTSWPSASFAVVAGCMAFPNQIPAHNQMRSVYVHDTRKNNSSSAASAGVIR